MQMREIDHERADRFINDTLDFLEKRSKGSIYKNKSKYRPESGFIELSSGELVKYQGEAPLVLHKEFDVFIVGNLLKLLREMQENVGVKLFAFAERTLYEYVTTWVFLTVHPGVKDAHKDRFKVLLLAGMYKFISNTELETIDYEEYIAATKVRLNAADLTSLKESDPYYEYFDKTYAKLTGTCRDQEYRKLSHSHLNTNPDFDAIKAHMHMRVHANPMSINESNGAIDRTVRHKIFLMTMLCQIIDYYEELYPAEHKELKWKYDKFRTNSRVRLT